MCVVLRCVWRVVVGAARIDNRRPLFGVVVASLEGVEIVVGFLVGVGAMVVVVDVVVMDIDVFGVCWCVGEDIEFFPPCPALRQLCRFNEVHVVRQIHHHVAGTRLNMNEYLYKYVIYITMITPKQIWFQTETNQ